MKRNLTLALSKDEHDSHNDDYGGLINEILDLFEEVVKNSPPLGAKLLVIAYSDHPQCLIDHLPKHYLIVVERSQVVKDWCKFAYEFSHELCHIYCDPRVNNWFIESLCELASIYFLKRLGTNWKKRGWDFGNAFLSYKNDYVDRIKSAERLNGYNDDTEWLKNEIKVLQTSIDRGLNSAIALKLFPLFESDSNYWEILPFLNKAINITVEGDNTVYDKTIIDISKLKEQLELNGINIDLSLIQELWSCVPSNKIGL